MNMPTPRPQSKSPLAKAVEDERKKDDGLEENNQALTTMAHAFGLGIIGELIEGTNANPDARPENDIDGLNIDIRARIDPSKSFMPK